jgi:LysR family transcriptional activator of nhaA
VSALNHHHLHLFYVFGKTLSFTRTAEELRVAQSAVTSQIRKLEESLGLPLIDRRNPRRPALTPEGRKVLEYADAIFESSRELEQWAAGGGMKQRAIRIGAISGLSRNLQFEFMSPLLGKPEYRYEVVTGDQQHLLGRLVAHDLDVVLSSRSGGTEGLRIQAHVLTRSPVVLVSNRSPRVRSSSTAELLQGSDVFLPGSSFEAHAELGTYLESRFRGFRVAGHIEDIALLRILALRSGSVVAVPEMGVRVEVESGELKILARLEGIEQKFYALELSRLKPDPVMARLIRGMSRRR